MDFSSSSFYTRTQQEIEEMVNELELKQGEACAVLPPLPESLFPAAPWGFDDSSSSVCSSPLYPIILHSDPPVTAALPQLNLSSCPVVETSAVPMDIRAGRESGGPAVARDRKRKRPANKPPRRNMSQRFKILQEIVPSCRGKTKKAEILDAVIETLQEHEKMTTQQNMPPFPSATMPNPAPPPAFLTPRYFIPRSQSPQGSYHMCLMHQAPYPHQQCPGGPHQAQQSPLPYAKSCFYKH